MTKIALVVGASSGVGRACLSSLAGAGCTVVGAARRVERIRKHLAQLPQAEPPHEAYGLDVTSREGIEGLASALLSRSLTPDILVYCAGINQYGMIHEFDKDAWGQTFAVNTRGAFEVCSAFVPHLRKDSRIVIVGSTAGLQPFEGGTIYCASKAALHAFAVALRYELRPRGITVSTVIPGSINTEFWKTSRPDAEELLRADLVGLFVAQVALAPAGSEVSEIVLRPTTEV